MKRYSSLAFAAILSAAAPILAQVSFGGRPVSFTHQFDPAPLVTLPAVDVATLMAEDAERAAQRIKGPWRFGFNHAVDLGLDNSGVWLDLPNGDRLWRIAIESPGALSINLEFHEYVIPEGARVFVFNEAGEHLGAFTAESNPGEQVLGVTQIAGDRITIEYIEPASVAGQGALRIGQVTHAYRDVLGQMRGLGDSGSCNNNVICPLGDDWRDQIRSVAMITVGGSGMCTGTLINNCENDGTPYFLTANHCVFGSVSTWIFRFNWESPVCGQNQNGPTNQTVSGSSLLVNSAPTDVALLELNSMPPAGYEVFYSGWDRSNGPAETVVGIHHPSGDIKKISLEEDPVTAAPVFSSALNFWKVSAWDDGTTEGGSSGSGIWNQDGLLVGQLWGGEASCSYNFNDYYGRFDLSYPVLQPFLGNCGTQLQGYPETITSIAEEKSVSGIVVAPNPSTGIVLIQMPLSAGQKQLMVYDATGRAVVKEVIKDHVEQIQLDLSAHEQGMYFIQVESGSLRTMARLVISR